MLAPEFVGAEVAGEGRGGWMKVMQALADVPQWTLEMKRDLLERCVKHRGLHRGGATNVELSSGPPAARCWLAAGRLEGGANAWEVGWRWREERG